MALLWIVLGVVGYVLIGCIIAGFEWRTSRSAWDGIEEAVGYGLLWGLLIMVAPFVLIGKLGLYIGDLISQVYKKCRTKKSSDSETDIDDVKTKMFEGDLYDQD